MVKCRWRRYDVQGWGHVVSGIAALNVEGQRRLVSVKPADTVEATAFTAPKQGAVVLGIIIANNSASTVTATVRWTDTSATTDWDIVVSKSIAANDTGYINEIVLPLRATDLIKVTSGTASALTFTLLVAEPISPLAHSYGSRQGSR